MSKGFGDTSRVEVIDNFLSPLDLDNIRREVLSERFPWFFAESTVIGADGPSQFAHVIYEHDRPATQAIEVFIPFTRKLLATSLIRLKINITLPGVESEVPYAFHTDLGFEGDPKKERTKHVRTGIYYLNSTDGPTFVGEEKIECVENRFISFPHNIEHTGSSFTNGKRRVVLNVNYLP